MFSKKKSRVTTGKIFLTYDNITLRTYLHIAATGEYDKLIVKGDCSKEECLAVWEELVNRNNNGQVFSAYFDSSQKYALLISDYNTIKATLFILLFEVDNDAIAFLKRKGYVIDTSSRAKYDASLALAMKTSDNLLTKIQMKQNEIASMCDNGSRMVGFEEVVANISFLLGFTINDDITLARYNEYRRIIAKRHEQQQKQKTVK